MFKSLLVRVVLLLATAVHMASNSVDVHAITPDDYRYDAIAVLELTCPGGGYITTSGATVFHYPITSAATWIHYHSLSRYCSASQGTGLSFTISDANDAIIAQPNLSSEFSLKQPDDSGGGYRAWVKVTFQNSCGDEAGDNESLWLTNTVGSISGDVITPGTTPPPATVCYRGCVHDVGAVQALGVLSSAYPPAAGATLYIQHQTTISPSSCTSGTAGTTEHEPPFDYFWYGDGSSETCTDENDDDLDDEDGSVCTAACVDHDNDGKDDDTSNFCGDIESQEKNRDIIAAAKAVIGGTGNLADLLGTLGGNLILPASVTAWLRQPSTCTLNLHLNLQYVPENLSGSVCAIKTSIEPFINFFFFLITAVGCYAAFASKGQ